MQRRQWLGSVLAALAASRSWASGTSEDAQARILDGVRRAVLETAALEGLDSRTCVWTIEPRMIGPNAVELFGETSEASALARLVAGLGGIGAAVRSRVDILPDRADLKEQVWALAARPGFCRASAGESVPDFTPDPAKSFTRGDSEYFFDGKHPGVASFDTPKAIGERVGRVANLSKGSFTLDAPHDVAPGDGLCFVTSRGVVGTNVNGVDGGRITPNRLEGIVPGAEVYRNFDRRFNLALERSRTRRVIPATATVTASADGVSIHVTDCEGVMASASRTLSLERAKNPAANAATLRAQAMKSGDTIFVVREAEVRGTEWFVPASLAAELRREALEALLRARLARPLSHRILAENPAARYPSERIGAEGNVTNRLAETFYRDHGVREIAAPQELAPSFDGCRVMRSAYCIRREIGECLREGSRLGGPLYLEHGADRFRLEFDCAACEMSLVAEPRRKR